MSDNRNKSLSQLDPKQTFQKHHNYDRMSVGEEKEWKSSEKRKSRKNMRRRSGIERLNGVILVRFNELKMEILKSDFCLKNSTQKYLI